MRISFTSGIRSNNRDCRAKKLDEVPSGAGDGEEIVVVGDTSKDFEGSVVLEKQVHLYANATNVLEHVAKLHVLRVRAEPIETVDVSKGHYDSMKVARYLHIVIVDRQNMGYLCECLSQMRLVEMTGVIMKISMRHIFLVSCRPHSILPGLFSTHG